MALVADSRNAGWVKGYGVLAPAGDPWLLYGVFPRRADAEAHARTIDAPTRVVFGSHRPGSDDFIEGMSEIRSEP